MNEYTDEQYELSSELHDLTSEAMYSPDWDMSVREVAKVLLDQAQSLLGHLCMDCDVDTIKTDNYYMAQDEVWEQAVPGGKGMLCLSCLSTRLDRPLAPGDFKGLPMNDKHLALYGLAA